MISLALGIIGAIALGALVLAFIVVLGITGRWLHRRGEVEHEANKGKAEELRHRRKLQALAHERQLSEVLQEQAALPAAEPAPEKAKVGKYDVQEPLLTKQQRNQNKQHEREAAAAQEAEIADLWKV